MKAGTAPWRVHSRSRSDADKTTESAESGAAMVTALLAILITATMSMIALAVIMNQVMPTSYLRSSSQTIFAAEAGVQTALGQIRTAEGAPGLFGTFGDTDLLPCDLTGPVTGSSGDLTYEVTLRYFEDDPTGHDETWLAANEFGCPLGINETPNYALITSTGDGLPVAGLGESARNRQVQAVYEFQVTNSNLPGGLIFSFDSRAAYSGKSCLQAENPIVGSRIRYVPVDDCGSDDDRQLWIYSKTYQLQLAVTTIPSLGFPEPLCMTRPSSGSAGGVTLEACRTGASRWNQLFSWNGNLGFTAQRPDITDYASMYFMSSFGTVNDPTGSYLNVGTSSAAQVAWGSFEPDARVGAGNASALTHQIVNYLQFGRCFDVTRQNPSAYPYLIVYPCKQDPSGGTKLDWNHKFFYTEPAGGVGSSGPQQIYFLQNGTTKWCLTSPGPSGGRVGFTTACSTSASNQKWTRYANTGDYTTSYTFVDAYGQCIDLGAPAEATGDLSVWATVGTAACSGGEGQKWNAPPDAVSASVGGYQEIS